MERNENKELFVLVNHTVYTESDVKKMTPMQITDLIGKVSVGISIFSDKLKKLQSLPPRLRRDDWKECISKSEHAKMMLQQALMWITPIRKAKNLERKAGEDEMFRQVAKEILDGDLYSRILVKAQARLELA
jgi:hypothetical protein